MKSGRVKFFDEKKGFGFIDVFDTGEAIYVHRTGLIDKIKDHDQVMFEEKENDKGLVAINVKFLDDKNINIIHATRTPVERKKITQLSTKDIIKSISDNWRLEAKLENQKDYFYHINEVNSILNASKYYIIGRKGSGKSSISEYLLNINDFTLKRVL